MTGTKRRSLFWTVAGMFLLTVVLGSLLQWFIATAVLGPLESRETRSRAELVASSAAAEIGAIPGRPNAAEVESILTHQRERLGFRGSSMVYRGRDGLVVSHPRLGFRFRGGAPGDSAARSAPRDDGPRGREAGAGRRGPGDGRLDTLAQRPVRRGDATIGEVLVARRRSPRGALGFRESGTALLVIPVAVIASALAGLVIVRLLVRRLRSLERLATRVAEGDLSVRIEDRSGDEIGRLAEQLDRMTERIAEGRASLEENERQRRQLFADITHELATPLTSIRGLAETMLDPSVSVSAEERASYMRGLLEEANRLDRLISDLFDLARLEAGASPLARERLDWAALCGHTADRFQRRFEEANLKLTWREPPGPVWIDADGRRMEQVLENLLNNALRYVPSGGRVDVGLAPPSGPRQPARLAVTDDGPGLPEDARTMIFERFFRADGAGRPTPARDAKGSGLGLAIVREIVERHGGAVWAEAGEPRGLRVVVEIPASG